MDYKELKAGKLYSYIQRTNVPLMFKTCTILYTGNIFCKGGGGWVWDEYEFLNGKELIYLKEEEISYYVDLLKEEKYEEIYRK